MSVDAIFARMREGLQAERSARAGISPALRSALGARRRGGVSNTPPQNATSQGRDVTTERSEPTAERGSTLPPSPPTGAEGRDDGRGAQNATASNAGRVLARRVDALVVAFKAAIRPEVWERLQREKVEAARSNGGSVASTVGRVPFSLDKRGSSSGYSIRLVNADATVLVEDLREYDDSGRYAGPGWSVEVALRAAYLATHTRAQAYALARALAAALGVLGPRQTSERVRRADLAGDVELVRGLDFTTEDRGAFVGRSHKVADYEPASEAGASHHEIRTHWRKNAATTLTGFSFSAGADFQARLYDKSVEIARHEAGHEKPAIERALWARGGWSGGTVWRLEFQIRREALREGKIETLDELERELDSLWAYGTKRWLRMADRDGATRRHRSRTDDRWLLFQAVTFEREAAPIRRERMKRGGCSVGQVLGTIQSFLAGIGSTADTETSDGAARPVRAVFLENVARLAQAVPFSLGSDYLAMCRSKRARFASVDDLAACGTVEAVSGMVEAVA